MKKIIYKILILSVLFSLSQKINAQRNVVWVHGLNDNASAWQHYNQIFDNERTEFTNASSLRTTYPTNNGVNYSAYKVIQSMNTYYGDSNPTSGANHSRNLGIGHSMGGLMIRKADHLRRNQTKKFGGYITVTSPNYGAPIANSLIDGSVEDAVEDACTKLSAGPISQIIPLPFTILSGLATDELCDKFMDNNLVQNLLNYNETVEDLRVGSDIINTINNYTDNTNPNIPRISIWAQENSPVHWRMFSSAKFDNDYTLVHLVNSARGIYQGFNTYNTALGIACAVGGFWNPYCWAVSGVSFYRASQWRKGRNWIDDSENIWNSLIKTTRREQHQFWEEVFVEDYDYDDCTTYLDEEYPWPYDCGTFEYQWVTRWVSVNYPSDGFLPKYTQCLQGLPNNDGTKYKVNGANHLEVLNMSAGNTDETKVQFNRIFNREDWFGTN